MKHNLIAFILLCTLSLIVYINSLNNSFHFDDQHYVVENPYIRKIQNIPAFFQSPRYSSAEQPFTAHYRPLVVSSYALSYMLGELGPFGYHLINLGFHVGSAFLLFLILQAILTPTLTLPPPPILPPQGGEEKGWGAIKGAGEKWANPPPLWGRAGWGVKGGSFFAPMAAGLIFLVHPFNSEVVNYITARSSVMCAFFYLLAFYFWVKYRRNPPLPPFSKGGDKSPPFLKGDLGGLRVIFYLASLLSFLLAMLSKEIAITLPVVLWLYDLYFIPVRQKVDHLKRILYYTPFVISVAVPYLIIRKLFYGAFTASSFNRDFTINFYTQTKVIVEYLRLLLFPKGLTIDHPVRLARSFWEVDVVLSTGLLLAILGIAYYLWKCRRDWQIASFFILWFFITLLPIILIPLNAMLQENRAYLAGVGFAVFAGIGIGDLGQRRHIIWFTILIPLIIVYSSATIQRNSVWKNDITLWSDAAKKAPLSTRSYDNLGLAYDRIGNRQKAEEMYKKTLQLDPDYLYAHYNMGVLYHKEGKWEEAERYYQQAIRLDSAFYGAYYNLGLVYSETGKYQEAIEAYQKAISIDSRNPQAYNNLGAVYWLKGEKSEAVQAFLKAIEKKPDHFNAYYNLGRLYQEMGDYRKAIDAYQKALSIDPAYEDLKERLRQVKATG